MTNFTTPVGRLVQGSPCMAPQIDMQTNKPLLNADGTQKMGVFMAIAFPKVLPDGRPNTEFDALFALLKETAAAAWPALFPQGAAGPCVNPRFSMKYQDGDGYDQSGNSVSAKPGFAGHHILRFSTDYHVRCYHEGKFAAHEEIQDVKNVVKRGYWVRLVGEARSNNASGTQVPGISLYPNLLSLVAQGDEIMSGPDAATAFGAAAIGWRPPAMVPGMPTVPAGAVPPSAPAAPAAPMPPAVPTAPAAPVPPSAPGAPAAPVPPSAPAVLLPPPPPVAAPAVVLSPALAAQGITLDGLVAQGWTLDALVQQGYATRVA